MSHDDTMMKGLQELELRLQTQIDFSNSLAARLSSLEAAQQPVANSEQVPEHVSVDVPAQSALFVDTGIELVRTEEELDVARWAVLQSMIKDEQEAHAQLRQTFDTLPLLASQAFASVGSDAEKSPESSLTSSTACLDSAGRGAADAFKTLVKQLREEFNEQLQCLRDSLQKAVDTKMAETNLSLLCNPHSENLGAISALNFNLQSTPLNIPEGVKEDQSVAQNARDILQLARSPPMPVPAEGSIRIPPGPRSVSPVRFQPPRYAAATTPPVHVSSTPGPFYPARLTSNESTAKLPGALSVRCRGNPAERATAGVIVKTLISDHAACKDKGPTPCPYRAWTSRSVQRNPSPLMVTRATLPPRKLVNQCSGDYWPVQSAQVLQRQ